VPGFNHTLTVRAWNEPERPVELVDLIKKNRDVHRSRLGHGVIAMPCAEVLMPLPDIAIEGLLAVDLELMHVDRLAKNLLHRLHHAGMTGELREHIAVRMRCETGAWCDAILLANDFGAMFGVDARDFVAQHLHFGSAKERREKQVSVAFELLALGGGQFHGGSPGAVQVS